MTDLQGAVGRVQLRRLPAIVERRRDLAARYAKRLAAVPGIGLPAEPAWARSNWQSYCVRLPPGCDQRRVMQSMLDAGIATRPGIMCAHREPAFPPGTWSCGGDRAACGCPPGRCVALRESEAAQDHGLLLPLFDAMTEADQDAVAEALGRACRVAPAR